MDIQNPRTVTVTIEHFGRRTYLLTASSSDSEWSKCLDTFSMISPKLIEILQLFQGAICGFLKLPSDSFLVKGSAALETTKSGSLALRFTLHESTEELNNSQE